MYKPRKLSQVSNRRVKDDDKKHLSTNKGLPDNFETENHDLLRYWQGLWFNLADFRERRRRAMRYQRGDQWGDMIYNPDTGSWVKEEDYIREQGKVPLKQNIIRQLIKNLQGQYRQNPSKTVVYARDREDAAVSEMMTNAIQNVHDINHAREIYMAQMTEAAISGMAITKQAYKFKTIWDTEDVDIRMVNPNRPFFNGDLEDPRMDDLRTIGEIHDMTIDDVITTFARTEGDAEKIRRWYSSEYYKDFLNSNQTFSAQYDEAMDFFIPHNTGMCRVIEGWYRKAEWRTWVHDYYDGSYKVLDISLKELEKMNQERIQEFEAMGVPAEEVPLMEGERRFDQFWYVKYLTPYGHTLHEGDTPYDHKEHPYDLFMYPFIGGEVWGLVEDIIDQQRYVNRTITLMDFITGASAKGLLLIHEDSIPEGMNVSDFAEEWSRVGGVIKYKGKPGIPVPTQISNASVPTGLQNMLATQLQLTYDIMGIHQAIQGKSAKSGTPASLYAQEAENASINVKDFFESFNQFRERCDRKTMMLIKQFYNDKRLLAVTGTSYAPEAKIYDPEKARDVMFDLKVSQGIDTPIYRQVVDDILTKLLESQLIDLELYLENSSMPFADKLLQGIRSKQQQMAEQGMAAGGDQQLLQQMGQAGQQMQQQDPRMANMINQMQ